jgi:DMSO/TMAO reductase YedYZ molybdopterin-dependent catalytic subunit
MDTKDSRLVVHEKAPPNTETPIELLQAGKTPLPLFFTRNNFPVPPPIAPDAWQLQIDGLVENELRLGLDDLRRLPLQKIVSVLECTGNGRGRFNAMGGKAEGLPWGEGAVANAEWVGVPLRHVFAQAGVRPAALQAECRGAGLVRGVEIEKLAADGMLAFEMNGEPLPHLHGGPVRLVVPGWGGINWVKWIERMTLIDHESASSFNQDSYVLWASDGSSRGKATEMPVKSIFTAPRNGEKLEAGIVDVRGLAWTPGIQLAKVEVSFDGGQSWEQAELRGKDLGPFAWREFGLEKDLRAGKYELACRATGADGKSQPPQVEWNKKGYLMNAWHRLAIEIA